MSTIPILVQGGQLERIDGELTPRQSRMRCLYALPDASADFDKILEASDDPTWHEQQAYAFFNGYVSGQFFEIDKPLPAMKPMGKGVWEFKTANLRFFGWFQSRDVFILAKVVSKDTLRDPKVYDLAIAKTVAARDKLDLDHPKFIASKSQPDVISI